VTALPNRGRSAGTRVVRLALLALLLTAAACSRAPATTAPTEAPSDSGTPSVFGATATATAGAAVPRAPSLLIPQGTAPPAGTPAAAATALSQQQLDQAALSVSDLPPGFAITASGPGGPELGPDVLTSYQEEFQQRDVASTQSLQQTIVVIDLLGQYKDSTSALAGIRAINQQNLNQLLGSVSLTATPATIPAIGQDSQAFHFTGSTNGVSIGGYLIAFHQGPIAALLLTAGVQGSESLDQSVALAQKQAQKLAALG
jgi:hypothetical protein